MADMSRRERFKKQQEAKKKAEQEKKVQYGTSFDHPEYVVMPTNSAVIVRPFTENSVNAPIKGNDHRFFHHTFIKGDDGKKFPFSYGFEGWYNHPVGDIIRTIASGNYNKKEKTMEYDHKGDPLLQRILTNGEDNPMESGWKGSKVILMNVLDRSDSWCKKNKHTKVLVKSAKYNEEYENWNSSYGFPSSVLTEMEDISEKKQTAIVDMDFAIYRYHYKSPKVSGGQKIYYEVFAPEFDEQLFEYYKIEELSGLYVPDLITKEEESYGSYNFEEMDLYKPSSVNYFLGRMKSFLKEADEKYEQNWREQFTELAEKEKEEWKAKQKDEVEDESKSYAGHSVEDDDEDSEPEKRVERKSRRERQPVEEKEETTESDDPYASVDRDEYKGFDELTKEELELLEVSEDGVINYNVDEDDLDACQKCGHEFPLDLHTCPSCGAKYS